MRLLFTLTFGLIGLGILLGLGTWQIQRLTWKEDLLGQIERRISQSPEALPALPDPERDIWAPVQAGGTVMPGELHVLVSRKNIGAGYRIIAPLLLADGRRIMVDRGFVRAADKEAVRDLGPMRITGNLHWPDESDSYTPVPDRKGNIWFARDVATMAAALDTEPVLIVARSPTDRGVTPMPLDTGGIPNDHLQYAITWFSLALIWAVMTGYFLWRSRARKADMTQ